MRDRLVVVTFAQARLMYLRRPFRDSRHLQGVVGSRKSKILMRDRQANRQFSSSLQHHSYPFLRSTNAEVR